MIQDKAQCPKVFRSSCLSQLPHLLDDAARRFYAGHGFEDLPFGPRKAMIVRMADRKRNSVGTE